jgi:hypothetical protein
LPLVYGGLSRLAAQTLQARAFSDFWDSRPAFFALLYKNRPEE